jgi:transposase
VICPVEFTRELSALRKRRRKLRGVDPPAVPRGGNGAVDETHDVLLKAMAKKIRWWDAAEIIGVTDRTMRRWRKRLETEGYSGLVDRRKGKASDKRVPLARREEVLRLYQEVYFDWNIRHFHEKLSEEHGIELSYTWVRKALQGAGLVARGKRRGKHRKRRDRRPLPGMLLHTLACVPHRR